MSISPAQTLSQPQPHSYGIPITVGTLLAIELVSRTLFRVPTPGAILLLPVAYAAFTGGLRVGLISATLMLLYSVHFLAPPDQFFQFTGSSLQTIVVLALVATTMVFMMGNLKQRIEQLSYRNQLILHSAGEGICGLNLQGTITFLNPAAATICGWTVAELIGQPMHALVQCQDSNQGQATAGAPGPDLALPMAAEGLFWRKDGSTFPAEYTSSPIWEHRKVVGAVVTFRDISERQAAEAALQHLNADLEYRVVERTAQLEAINKELETFSYSVSHDLRAPLRSIDGFSQALLEDYGDRLDTSGQDYLRRVRAATQRMAQLIDDLLSLARVTRSELHHDLVNLSVHAAIIADELQQTQPERQVELVIAPGLVAQGDERLLHVVLENLIGNAWKFTSKSACPRIEFGLAPCDNQPAYFVRDNGAGFDMAYADKLFGAFQRLHAMTEFAGTGIGLATVQRIIHRHGGRVWAESTVDQGATFFFTLQQEASHPCIQK